MLKYIGIYISSLFTVLIYVTKHYFKCMVDVCGEVITKKLYIDGDLFGLL